MILELYINNIKADVPDNFSVSFTYKETEVTKPSAIKNSFSKSIVLDGTPTNNAIFSTIYRLDKIHGANDFNPNERTPFKLVKNSDIIESGYLQLDNITKNGDNVKYSCTLYGGLGSFFYALQTNPDGSEKSLADLYYGFADESKTNKVLTPEEENNNVLFRWNASYIFNSWMWLSRINDGTLSGHTDSNLMKPRFNVTAAPTYSGLYGDDFDSSHVLVNLNEMPSSVKQYFPLSYTEDGETYTPYLDENSGYTIVEVSRDLSEFEARDLRSLYQRRVIRNQIILDAICKPENNGGYNVVIDPEILNSRYYKNSYLLLDRFDTSKINNLSNTAVEVNWSGAMVRENDIDSFISKVSGTSRTFFNFSGITSPTLEFNFGLEISSSHDVDNLYSVYDCSYGYTATLSIYNGYLIRIDCYKTSGDTDVVYASTKDYLFTTGGFDTTDAYFQSGITKYVNYLNENFSGSEHYTYTKEKINYKTFEMVRDTERSDINLFKSLVPFSLQLTGMPNNVSSLRLVLRIKRFNVVKNRHMQGSYSNWVTEVSTMGQTYLKWSSKKSGSYNSGWTEQAYFKRIEEPKSYYHDAKINPMLSYLDITKKALFSDTKSPYRYLTDFTRMFNAKYEIDNYTKTIYIKLLRNFYTNQIENIDDKIDRSKDIKILPTIANTKWVTYSLETPDTYAKYLYNINNKVDYGALMVNTNYDFNNGSTNLFEDSVYTNVIPFRLSSNYFKTISTGGTIIPTCIQTPIYKTTLYKTTLSEIKQLDKSQNLTSSLLYWYGTPEKDFSYKLCCFDKDNNDVSDLTNSLVFFSGWDDLPFNMIISDNHDYMTKLNGKPCYLFSYSEYDCTNNKIASFMDGFPRFSKYFDVDEDNPLYVTINNKHTDVIQASFDFNIPTQTFIEDPASYDESATIYYQYWKNYISDLYDTNNKQISCYVFLNDKPQNLLKKFFYFDNCIWVLNEITNYDSNSNKPTKCTFIKVKDINNYLS